MSESLESVAKNDKDVLAQFMDDYLGELIQYKEIKIGPGKTCEYKFFDWYWSESCRHPFFITNSIEIVGFALVRKLTGGDIDSFELSEFYILPKHRKHGYGKRAVTELFARFNGHWKLQVYSLNKNAQSFWRSCLNSHCIKELKL